jgi:hypothetical protein
MSGIMNPEYPDEPIIFRETASPIVFAYWNWDRRQDTVLKRQN